MSKRDEIMKLVRDHRAEIQKMQDRIGRIDSELKQEVQDRKRSEIEAEHQNNLDAYRKNIRNFRQELQSDRQAELNPMRSLFRAAYERNDEVNAGLANLLSCLDVFDSGTLVELANQYLNPHIVLAAWKTIDGRSDAMTRQEKTEVLKQLHQTAAQYIDSKAVREAADLERQLVDQELFEIDNLSSYREPNKRLTLAHEHKALVEMASETPIIHWLHKRPELEPEGGEDV